MADDKANDVIEVSPQDAPPKESLVFTDHGCRTELRAGTLLVLAAVFVWLWLGPGVSGALFMLGMPLVLIGVPLQALDSRNKGRPGYPLKLGLTLLIGGSIMWYDLLYRDAVAGALRSQPMAPMLVMAGAWMVLWWPVSRASGTKAEASVTVKTEMA